MAGGVTVGGVRGYRRREGEREWCGDWTWEVEKGMKSFGDMMILVRLIEERVV
jgi:hypothetical protein